MDMSEREQMIHMLVRVSRLAAERWGMQLSQAAELLGSSGALGCLAYVGSETVWT